MTTRIYDSVLDLIGSTPMVRLGRFSEGLPAEIVAKAEFRNPTCSVKDRIALAMIEDAEARGVLRPGATIVEPTTGNTGIALSLVAVRKGYRMIVVMPEFVSLERRAMAEALGAEVVLTPEAAGIPGVLAEAQAIVARTPGAFMPDQFTNPANPGAHVATGREILEATGGELTAFVAAAGTGGSLTGIARALRAAVPSLHVAVVEPAGSAVLSGGAPGPHAIQGVGEGFVPAVLDTRLYDEVITVTDAEAFAAARRCVRLEGLFVGISAGANLHAALAVASRVPGRVVTLLPDCGLRYLSTALFPSTAVAPAGRPGT